MTDELKAAIDLLEASGYEVTKQWSFGHVLSRELIHVFSGGLVAMASLWLFWVAERKISWWPKFKGWGALAVPAILSTFVISLREYYDAGHGPWAKSYFDVAFWLIGTGGAMYIMYRLSPRLEQIIRDIKGE